MNFFFFNIEVLEVVLVFAKKEKKNEGEETQRKAMVRSEK